MGSLRAGVVLVVTGTLVACTAAESSEGSGSSDLVAACPVTSADDRAALRAIPAAAATCADVSPPDGDAAHAGFHAVKNLALSLLPAIHRGRDAMFAVGEPQWVLGKIAFGTNLALEGEDVELWVLRGCTGAWEKLGTTRTTAKGEHAAVEGMEDDGGRVYFPIPDAQRLGVGRHRVRLVVAGDRSGTDQYIEVLPRGTPLFVSDVDGTLTERLATDSALVCDEESELPAIIRTILDGALPEPSLHEGASALYASLASAGYRPVYLSARSELLTGNTRAFLRESKRNDGRGDLPAGIVHTTFALFGASNAAAQAFKTDELARLRAKGFLLELGFGNRTSDVGAYTANAIPYRFSYDNPATGLRDCSNVEGIPSLPAPYPELTAGDFRFQHYDDLAPAISAVGPVCTP